MWTTITLEMQQSIENIRLGANKICASHAFTSMFLWQDAMQLTIWLEPDGYLVQQRSRGENHYFFPCGTDEAKIRMLSMLPPDAVLHYADAQDLAFMERWRLGGYTAQVARGDWEYLYDRQAQLELDGVKYKKIRQGIAHVRSIAGWHVQPIDTHNLATLKDLEAQWESLSYNRIGDADRIAAQTAIDSFEKLELIGIIAFVEQAPVGYFLGSLLHTNVFFGIIQRVVDPSYYPMLRWEVYNMLSKQVLTINLEEDMDLEGLRHNKMLLRPDGFHEMWDVALTVPQEENIT